MSRLDFIRYEFYEAELQGQALSWKKSSRAPIERLPQLFWEDGQSWDEANVWALERAASADVVAGSVERQMKFLRSYAEFLESHGLDWLHIPARKEGQPLRKFRGYLMSNIKSDKGASSTASNCINTVIQFYRFAKKNGLIDSQFQLWEEVHIAINYHGSVGYRKAVDRITTDLRIPNRSNLSETVEDGLLPLRSDHMIELLRYTADYESDELHLMLSTGFFSGARIGTVVTLTVSCLETAYPDPHVIGAYLIPVGPGTGISTKFSVSGKIMVPQELMKSLRVYAYSTGRLLREAKAQRVDKDKLFITRRGNPYTADAVNRLVGEMRIRATKSGLKFMENFKFHQSRATFGSWFMNILLDSGVKPSRAIGVVQDAMLHKNEQSTWKYIKFIERNRGKEQAVSGFNSEFLGITDRNWDNEGI